MFFDLSLKYNKIPNNSVGELVVETKDPGLMIKYWRDPHETKKKFKNNLFLMIDLIKQKNSETLSRKNIKIFYSNTTAKNLITKLLGTVLPLGR